MTSSNESLFLSKCAKNGKQGWSRGAPIVCLETGLGKRGLRALDHGFSRGRSHQGEVFRWKHFASRVTISFDTEYATPNNKYIETEGDWKRKRAWQRKTRRNTLSAVKHTRNNHYRRIREKKTNQRVREKKWNGFYSSLAFLAWTRGSWKMKKCRPMLQSKSHSQSSSTMTSKIQVIQIDRTINERE